MSSLIGNATTVDGSGNGLVGAIDGESVGGTVAGVGHPQYLDFIREGLFSVGSNWIANTLGKNSLQVEFSGPDSDYIWSLEPANWADASAAAVAEGGYLAAINDQAEQDLIYSNIAPFYDAAFAWETLGVAQDGGDVSYVWLGGSDAAAEGTWTWANQDAWTYTHWGTGAAHGGGSEPDNYNDQDGLALGLENWPYGAADGAGYGDAGWGLDIG